MTELRAEFDERVAAEAAAKAEAAAAAAAAEASRRIREGGRGGGSLVVIDLIVFCELHVSSRFFFGWHRSFKFRTSSSNKDKDKLLVSSGDFSHPLGLVWFGFATQVVSCRWQFNLACMMKTFC